MKINISWYKSNEQHCVINDAMRDSGGVSVFYQRSYEDIPAPWHCISSDVVFGFSRQSSHIEIDQDSIIPYYVVTGYLGDHRAPLLKQQAQMIRSSLVKNGAKRVIAYFDENTAPDFKWNVGHRGTCENYSYLLEKVLSDPLLGLIIKPKAPATLRKRLGGVAEYLSRAEATGRCIVMEEGSLHGAYPPTIASLCADVAIHGHLFSATAGLESALTGVPTLLLDREGWSLSSLNRLKEGKVIFKDWDKLWQACLEHWNSPEGVSGFGDWEEILDTLDPFRDGQAANRMGTYLEWILDGFKANMPRETVLADAAERYRKIWGEDKILSINCPSNEYSAVG